MLSEEIPDETCHIGPAYLENNFFPLLKSAILGNAFTDLTKILCIFPEF